MRFEEANRYKLIAMPFNPTPLQGRCMSLIAGWVSGPWIYGTSECRG